MTKKEIIEIIQKDPWMMSVLTEADKLNLPDWMIGAGFLRNKIWDYLHKIRRNVADTDDIDLVYFDALTSDEHKDKKLSENMNGVLGLRWEIINQAYTHVWHGKKTQYLNTEEALSEWVETATCVAVTIRNGKLTIIAPHGISDLVNLIVRPSPAHKNSLELFYHRIKSKHWLTKWPKLQVAL